MRLTKWLTVTALILCPGGRARAAELDQATAVKAHAAALAALRSFDVTFEYYDLIPGKNGSPDRESKIWVERWSKDGAKQRFRREFRDRVFNDDFFDGSQLWTLQGWNPHKPPTLTPRSQQRVRASLLPGSKFDEGKISGRDLLFSFLMTGAISQDGTQSDAYRTLPELVAKSPKTEFRAPSPTGKEGKLAVLTVALPGIGDDPPDGNYFVITLDPAVNYLARRVEEHNLKFLWIRVPSRERVREHLVDAREVTQFRDCGHGVYFPAEVHERVIRHASGGDVVSHSRMTATSIVVNQPLPPDAFDFRFPDNAIVTKVLNPNSTKAEAWIWGPDNKPLRRFRRGQDRFGD